MSEVILDTITGKSTATTITIGSTPLVSASANSMTIRGEGTAQTSIQQGLGKAWLRMDGGDGGSISTGDSFNIASVTDQASGNYRVAITNDMSSAQYSATTAGGGSADNNTLTAVSTPNPNFAAGTLDLDCVYVHTTAFDPKIVSLALHGDLA